MSDVPSRSSSTAPLETLESEEEIEEVQSSKRSIRASRPGSVRSPKVEPEPMETLSIEEPSELDMEEQSERSGKSDSWQQSKNCCESMWVKLLIPLIIITVLLIIILVPLGYNELEYYEMGFHHNMATGYVDTSMLYHGGRHWVGVNGHFISYPSIALREFYSNVSVFNKEKIEVKLSFSFTYKLRTEDLKTLHETYGQGYRPIIRSASLAAVKGAAVKYTIYEFRRRRSKVTEGLSEAVSSAVGGKCCRENCFYMVCRPGCMAYWKCDKDRDVGYFAALQYFQLHRIYVSHSQSENFLKKVLEQEMEDRFRYEQEEQLVRMRTEQLELEYSNEAAQITQNATAESTMIKLAAVTEAESVVEYYRNQGLRLVFDALNVTEEEYKKSLDYVITLRNQNKANLYLGFQYMVANP